MDFNDHLQQSLERDPEFKREWELHEDCFQEQKRLTRWLIRAQQQRDRAHHKAKQLEERLKELEERLSALENKGTYICPHCKRRVRATGMIGGGCPACGKRYFDPPASREPIDWEAFKERHSKWPFTGGYLGPKHPAPGEKKK